MPAHRKYYITPELHDKIKEIYDNNMNKLEGAKRLKLSKSFLNRYAVENNLTKKARKFKKWTDEEIRILHNNSRYRPETIKKKLKAQGYERTLAGIIWKIKDERCPSNLKGQSQCKIAECFGVTSTTVSRWIEKGYLKAERRGFCDNQNRDPYYITNYHIKNFITENPELVDLTKVDKWWFIDLAFGGKNGLSPLSLDDSTGEGDNFI